MEVLGEFSYFVEQQLIETVEADHFLHMGRITLRSSRKQMTCL